MYEKLKEIHKLAWKNDDRIDQETLFKLQEKIAELLFEVAVKENKMHLYYEECKI